MGGQQNSPFAAALFQERCGFFGAHNPDASAKGGMRMTLSEVLLLLTFVSSVAYGVFDITWKISHDDKRYKNKKD